MFEERAIGSDTLQSLHHGLMQWVFKSHELLGRARNMFGMLGRSQTSDIDSELPRLVIMQPVTSTIVFYSELQALRKVGPASFAAAGANCGKEPA